MPLSPAGPPALGTLCLISGTLLGCLTLAELSTGLPFAMPRFWYLHREAWGVVAIGLCLAGAAMLRTGQSVPAPRRSDWKPTKPGQRFHELVLYSRNGCHLCDHALDLLAGYAAYLPQVIEVDIDADPGLVEKFGQCVPVVEVDGRVRFRGGVDERLLRRLIEGTAPLGGDSQTPGPLPHSHRT